MLSIAAPRHLFPPRNELRARPTPRATVWLPALAVVAFAGIYLPLASLLVSASNQPQSVAAASSPVAKVPSAAPAASAAPSLPTCTPAKANQPAAVELDSRPSGLTALVEPLATYQIYGTSAADLRRQIQHCAPGASSGQPAEFTGETSYNLSWQYDTRINGNSCQLSGAKVGVRIVTSLPNWQATTSAAPGLAERWQAFMTGLISHEQGHAALDKMYASKLVGDLSSLGQIPCSQLATNVQAIVQADISALNQANDQYDQQTDHGASQGATLPSY